MNLTGPRDEREQGIDRSGDRLTAMVLSYGLLVLVLLRSMHGEAAWDLLGLVIVGGAVGTTYRIWHRAVSRRWVLALVLLGAVSFMVAASIALALHA